MYACTHAWATTEMCGTRSRYTCKSHAAVVMLECGVWYLPKICGRIHAAVCTGKPLSSEGHHLLRIVFCFFFVGRKINRMVLMLR
jgi:hypothetical protein